MDEADANALFEAARRAQSTFKKEVATRLKVCRHPYNVGKTHQIYKA